MSERAKAKQRRPKRRSVFGVGSMVRFTDKSHRMCGWVGVVTDAGRSNGRLKDHSEQVIAEAEGL